VRKRYSSGPRACPILVRSLREVRSVIKCTKCSKENQDHYKFCLGCGSELPKDAPKQFQAEPAISPPAPAPAEVAAAPIAAAAPAPGPATAPAVAAPVATSEVPPAAATNLSDAAPAPVIADPTPAPAAAPAEAAAEAAAANHAAAVADAAVADAAVADAACPQCGHENPSGNRFCAACGYKLAGAAPAVSAPPPEVAPAASSGISLTALRADGTEAGQYDLPAQPTVTIGRDTGTIFAGDSYLSPRHATFTVKSDSITVRDEGSLNGVYVKLKPNDPFYLEPNAVFRIGQEIVRYEALESQAPVDGVERFGSPAQGIVGRLALVVGRDTTGNAFPIPKRGLHLGRERGDVLFSEDGYVSGLHCQIAPGEDGRVYLTDVGSSNGTFVRVRENHSLRSGDILLMGQQVFRLDA